MTTNALSLPDRIRAYLAACPGAVSGQAGHVQTFTVAVALVNGFALGESEALAYLQEFNQKCSPPWNERELQHKIQSAITSDHEKPRGHLLGDNRMEAGRHPAPVKAAVPAAPPGPKYALPVSGELPEPLPDGARALIRAAFKEGEFIGACSTILGAEGRARPDDPRQNPPKSFTREQWLAALDEAGGDPNELFDHCAGKSDGAWIRINPMAQGRESDADVTAFRHVLIEFDKIPQAQQWSLYQQSNLPCTAIINSGGKSIHAWVRVDAPDLDAYKLAVAVLYDHFVEYKLDGQNKNPSRYSRMPGVPRGTTGRQTLLALNVGAPSFAAWRADQKQEEESRLAELNDPLGRLSSPEDEQGLLGCLILETELAVLAIKKHALTGHGFHRQTNRVWFDRLMDLTRRNLEITLPNAAAQFNGDLQKYGGLAYFDELKAAAANPYSAETHIPRLKELQARRLVARAANQASLLAYNLAIPTDRLLVDFKQTIEMMVPERGGLPQIFDAHGFTAITLPEPKQLISGILHQGSKMVLGGGSKSFKTWQLLDLAVSVSHQLDWLKFQTCFGKVLYVNFEIQDFAWQARVRTVARAKAVDLEPGRLTLWNLRGFAADYKTLLPRIREAIEDAQYSMIILDPAYKLYGEADENSAGDIAGLCNAIENLAVKTGAAVVFGAHFSKGNQSGKEAIDRVSGSGVFARDPDSLITLTRHEEDGCFSVEPILRNFPHIDPFVVRWQFPLMLPQDDLNPDDLKKQAGRKREHDPVKLLAEIANSSLENPVSISSWAENAGIPRQTLTDYLPKLRNYGWVLTTGEGKSARQYITQKGRDALP